MSGQEECVHTKQQTHTQTLEETVHTLQHRNKQIAAPYPRHENMMDVVPLAHFFRTEYISVTVQTGVAIPVDIRRNRIQYYFLLVSIPRMCDDSNL
jgi:hypothetical protein